MVYKHTKDDTKTTNKITNNNNKVELHKTEQSNPTNQLRTVFAKQSTEQLEHNKQLSRQPIVHIPEPHISIDYYSDNVIDIPVRPQWTSSMTKEQLDHNETTMFNNWLQNIYNKYTAEQLNHFEHNLQVWRQLWRVCERSNICIVIADCRNPLFNVPPSLYNYITHTLNKPMILVLNKIDYITQQCVDEWIQYFNMKYPKLHVIPYTSKPNEVYADIQSRLKQIHRKKAGGALRLEKPVGADLLLDALRNIVKQYREDKDNISKLKSDVIDNFSFDTTFLDEKLGKLNDTQKSTQHNDDSDNDTKHTLPTLGPASRKARVQDSDSEEDTQTRAQRKHGKKKQSKQTKSRNSSVHSDNESEDDSDHKQSHKQTTKHKNKHNVDDDTDESDVDGDVSSVVQTLQDDTEQHIIDGNYISLGFIGYPNSGKSSVINSLCGRKLVSVSSTPGHTKYLQSIYLNKYTCLLDSPGLVFPAANMPRAIQVLAGCYPIAQTRDPYTAVMYLAQRIDLVKLYKLQPSPQEHDYDDFAWSAWTICEAYANKKGYRNRKGILDVYRAANEILRDQLQGKVLLYYWPPTHNTN